MVFGCLLDDGVDLRNILFCQIDLQLIVNFNIQYLLVGYRVNVNLLYVFIIQLLGFKFGYYVEFVVVVGIEMDCLYLYYL